MNTTENCPNDPVAFALPQIQRVGDQDLLTGIIGQPLPLWTVSVREQQTAKNVLLAQSLAKEVTPIFIGIEHLPLLLNDWPRERAVILIEKCGHHAKNTLKNTSVPENIHLVVGELGFFVSFKDNKNPIIGQTFFFEEIAALALKLMQLPDAIFGTAQIFLLPEHTIEKQFNTLLIQAIHTVLFAKAFHMAAAQRYESYRAQPKQDCLVCLALSEGDRALLANHCARVLPHLAFQSQILDMNPEIPAYTQIFYKKQLNRQTIRDPKFFLEQLEPFMGRTNRVFELLSSTHPQIVVWRNRAPFYHLEDMLFTEEMLRRLELPTYAFCQDYFSMSCLLFQGAWSLLLHFDLWQSPQSRYFLLDPLVAALTKPERFDTHVFSFTRAGTEQPVVAQPASKQEIKRDLAVVHTCRVYTMEHRLFSEVFRLCETLTADTTGHTMIRTTMCLQKWLKAHAKQGLNTYFFRMLVNTWQFYFYGQHRPQRLKGLLSRLGKYKLEVFGSGWEGIIPKTLCKGMVSHNEVITAYHESALTLDISQDWTFYDPHPNVIECLQAGGLPLVSYPLFDRLLPDCTGFETSQKLDYFKTDDELISKIEFYLNHWHERQAAITRAQQTWLKDLLTPKPAALPAESLKSVQKLDWFNEITGNQETDNFILKASIGYLFMMAGYFERALDIWETILFKTDFFYAPLIVRAIETALTIEDQKRAQKLLAFGIAGDKSNPHWQTLQTRVAANT